MDPADRDERAGGHEGHPDPGPDRRGGQGAGPGTRRRRFLPQAHDREWLLGRLITLEVRGPLNTVLIIDDDEADRYLLKGLLLVQGRFAIVETTSGEEGLRRAREERPDVIFLDLIMSDMTGFEVLVVESRRQDKGHPCHPQYLGNPGRRAASAAHRWGCGGPFQIRRVGGGGVRADPEALIHAGLKVTSAGTES